MEITQADMLATGLCIAFAVLFSLARTLADNRDEGPRGRALGWLLMVNGIVSLAGGTLSPILGDLFHLERKWSFVLSAVIGWTGLAWVMDQLEKTAKEKLHGSPEVRSGGRSGLGSLESDPVQTDQQQDG